ncbi:MAG: leukotriene A4 hydrolase C-terminal domain-containing protein, partial [Bacteroidota bacterium]
SWSGNLVTNATWDDFWLNEGFTVYVENRIMEALKGRDYAEMLAYISYTDLQEEVADIGFENPDTRLAYELTGRHPDDGFSSVPYDKGYYFLRLIEETVGREDFDAFLKGYFSDNAFKTMSTDRFLERLDKELLSTHPGAEETINVDAWVRTAGIPDNIPVAQSVRFKKVEEAVHAWVAGESASSLPTQDWTTHEWLHFIQVLPDELNAGQMAKLDGAFGFTARTNSEIQAKWYTRAIKAQYEPAYPAVRTFLTSVGRRKFLTPLYRAMMAAPETQGMAADIYAEARAGYHPIAQNSIDAVVNQ